MNHTLKRVFGLNPPFWVNSDDESQQVWIIVDHPLGSSTLRLSYKHARQLARRVLALVGE